MTTATIECTSTAASITEVLLGGDLILNLSGQVLATAQGARYLQVSSNSGSGSGLQVTKHACCVAWDAALPACFSSLSSLDADRIVVVVDAASDVGQLAVRELTACGLRCLLCTLSEDCGAEAFMDEEDAEAVAARLRQLGYL